MHSNKGRMQSTNNHRSRKSKSPTRLPHQSKEPCEFDNRDLQDQISSQQLSENRLSPRITPSLSSFPSKRPHSPSSRSQSPSRQFTQLEQLKLPPTTIPPPNSYQSLPTSTLSPLPFNNLPQSSSHTNSNSSYYYQSTLTPPHHHRSTHISVKLPSPPLQNSLLSHLQKKSLHQQPLIPHSPFIQQTASFSNRNIPPHRQNPNNNNNKDDRSGKNNNNNNKHVGPRRPNQSFGDFQEDIYQQTELPSGGGPKGGKIKFDPQRFPPGFEAFRQTDGYIHFNEQGVPLPHSGVTPENNPTIFQDSFDTTRAMFRLQGKKYPLDPPEPTSNDPKAEEKDEYTRQYMLYNHKVKDPYYQDDFEQLVPTKYIMTRFGPIEAPVEISENQIKDLLRNKLNDMPQNMAFIEIKAMGQRAINLQKYWAIRRRDALDEHQGRERDLQTSELHRDFDEQMHNSQFRSSILRGEIPLEDPAADKKSRQKLQPTWGDQAVEDGDQGIHLASDTRTLLQHPDDFSAMFEDSFDQVLDGRNSRKRLGQLGQDEQEQSDTRHPLGEFDQEYLERQHHIKDVKQRKRAVIEHELANNAREERIEELMQDYRSYLTENPLGDGQPLPKSTDKKDLRNFAEDLFDMRVLLDDEDVDAVMTPQGRAIYELTKRRHAELDPTWDGPIWADEEQSVIDKLEEQHQMIVQQRKNKLHDIHDQMEEAISPQDRSELERKARELDYTQDELLELLITHRLNEKKVERRQLIIQFRTDAIQQLKENGEDDADAALIEQYIEQGMKVYDEEEKKRKDKALDDEVATLDLEEIDPLGSHPKFSLQVDQVIQTLSEEGKLPENDDDLAGKTPEEAEKMILGMTNRVLTQLKRQALEEKYGNLRLLGIDPQADQYAQYLQHLDLDREDIKIIQQEFKKFKDNKRWLNDFDQINKQRDKYITQNQLSSSQLLSDLASINNLVLSQSTMSPQFQQFQQQLKGTKTIQQNPLLITDPEKLSKSTLEMPFSTHIPPSNIPTLEDSTSAVDPFNRNPFSTKPKKPFSFTPQSTSSIEFGASIEEFFPNLESARLSNFFLSLNPNTLSPEERHNYNTIYRQNFQGIEMMSSDPELVDKLKRFQQNFDNSKSSHILRKGDKDKDKEKLLVPSRPLTPRQRKLIEALPHLISPHKAPSTTESHSFTDDDYKVILSELTLANLGDAFIQIYSDAMENPQHYVNLLVEAHQSSAHDPGEIDELSQLSSKNSLSRHLLQPLLQLQEQNLTLADFKQFLKEYSSSTLESLQDEINETKRVELLSNLHKKMDSKQLRQTGFNEFEDSSFDQLSDDGLESTTSLVTRPIKSTTDPLFQHHIDSSLLEAQQELQDQLLSGKPLNHEKLHDVFADFFPDIDTDSYQNNSSTFPQQSDTTQPQRAKKPLLSTQEMFNMINKHVSQQRKDNLPRHIESLQSISELLKMTPHQDQALAALNSANKLARELNVHRDAVETGDNDVLDQSATKHSTEDELGKMYEQRMAILDLAANDSFLYNPSTQRLEVKYPIVDPIMYTDNMDTLVTTTNVVDQSTKQRLLHEFTNRPIYQTITIPVDRLRISNIAIDRLIDVFRQNNNGDKFFGSKMDHSRSTARRDQSVDALLKEMTEDVSFSHESLEHLATRLKSVNLVQLSKQYHEKMDRDSRVLQLTLALGGHSEQSGKLRIGPNGFSLNDTGIVGSQHEAFLNPLSPTGDVLETSGLFNRLQEHVSQQSPQQHGKFSHFIAQMNKNNNGLNLNSNGQGVAEFVERVSLAATPVHLINPILLIHVDVTEQERALGRPEPVIFTDHFGWAHDKMWPELQWYKEHQNKLSTRDIVRMQYMDQLFMEYQRYLSMKGLFLTYHPEFAPQDELEVHLMKHYQWKRNNSVIESEKNSLSATQQKHKDLDNHSGNSHFLNDSNQQLLSPAMQELRRESEYNLHVAEDLLLKQLEPDITDQAAEKQIKEAYETQRYPSHEALREFHDLEHQELRLRQKLQPVPTISELREFNPNEGMLPLHEVPDQFKSKFHIIPTHSDIPIMHSDQTPRIVHPFQIDAVGRTEVLSESLPFSKPFIRPEIIQEVIDQLHGVDADQSFVEPDSNSKLQIQSPLVHPKQTNRREEAMKKIETLKKSFLSPDSQTFDKDMTFSLHNLNAQDQRKDIERIILSHDNLTETTLDLRRKVATQVNSTLQLEIDFLTNFYAEIAISEDGMTSITKADPDNPHLADAQQTVKIDVAELYQEHTLPTSELERLQNKLQSIDSSIDIDNDEIRKLEHIHREKILFQFDKYKHQIGELIAERNHQFAQDTEDQFNAEKRRVLLPLDRSELSKLPIKDQEEHLHIQFIKSVLDFTKAVFVDVPSTYDSDRQIEYVLEQRRKRFLIHKSKHWKQSFFWGRVKHRIDSKLSIEHLKPDFEFFKLTDSERSIDDELDYGSLTYDLDVVVREEPWKPENIQTTNVHLDFVDDTLLAPQRDWFNRPNTTFLANLLTIPWTKYDFVKKHKKELDDKIASGQSLSEVEKIPINDSLKLNGEALTITERKVEHDKEELRLILAHVQLQDELKETTKSIANENEFSELHQRLISKIDTDWKLVEKQYDELIQQTTRAFQYGEIDNQTLEDRLIKLSNTFQQRSKELETQHMKYMKFFNDYILYSKDLQTTENLTRLRALQVLQESDSYRQRQLRIEQITLTLDQIRTHERARIKLQELGIDDKESGQTKALDSLSIQVFDATGKAYTKAEIIQQLEELAQLIEEQKTEQISIVNFLQKREDIFKRRKNLRDAVKYIDQKEDEKSKTYLSGPNSPASLSKEHQIIIQRLRQLAIDDSLQGKTVRGVTELLSNIETMSPAEFQRFDYDGRFSKALSDVKENLSHAIDIKKVLGTQYTPLVNRRPLEQLAHDDDDPQFQLQLQHELNAENPDIAPPRDARFYGSLSRNFPIPDQSVAYDNELVPPVPEGEYNPSRVLDEVFPELDRLRKQREEHHDAENEQWGEEHGVYTPLQLLVQETRDILEVRDDVRLRREIEMELQILKDMEMGLYTNLHQFRYTNEHELDRTKIDPLTGRYIRKWIIPPQWDSSKHPPQEGDEDPYFIDPITTPDEVKKALLYELQIEQLGGELLPMERIYDDNFLAQPIPTYRDVDVQRGKYDYLLPQKDLREKRKPPKPKRPLLPELPFQMPFMPYYEGEDVGPWDGETRLRREQIYLINLYRRQKKRIRYEHKRKIRDGPSSRHHRRPKRYKIRPPIHEEMETYFRERPGPLERWDYENLSRTEWLDFNLLKDGGRTNNIIHRFLETEDYRLFFKWRKGYVRGLYFFKFLFRKYSTPQGTIELLGNSLLILTTVAMLFGITREFFQWENVQLAGAYQNYLHHKHLAYWYNSIRRVVEMDLVRWNELFSVVGYFRGENSGSDPMIAYMYNHENWAEWFRQKTLKGSKIRVPLVGDGPTAYQPREVMPAYRVFMKNTLNNHFEREAHHAYVWLNQFESAVDSRLSQVINSTSEKEKIRHLSRLIDPLTKITEVAYSRDNKLLRPGILEDRVNPLRERLKYTYDRLVLPAEIIYKDNPLAPYEKEIRAIPSNIYPRSGWGVDPISSRLFEQYSGVLCKEEYLAALDQERNMLEKIRNYLVLVGNQFGMNIPTNRLQVLALDVDQQISAQHGFAREEWIKEHGDKPDITILADNAGLRYKYFSPLRQLSQQFNSLIQSTSSPLLSRQDNTAQQLELMALSKQFGTMNDIYGPSSESQKSDWKKGYHNLITPVSSSPQIGRLFSLSGDFTSSTTYPYPVFDLTDPSHRLAHSMLTTHHSKGMTNPLIPTASHRPYVDNEYYPFVDTSAVPDRFKPGLQYKSRFVRLLHALSGEKYTRYFYATDHNTDYLKVLTRPNGDKSGFSDDRLSLTPTNTALGNSGYSGMNISPTSSTADPSFNNLSKASTTINFLGSLLKIPLHIFENSKLVQREQMVEVIGNLIIKYDSCISMIIQEQHRVGQEQQEILQRRNLMLTGRYQGEESMFPKDLEVREGFLRELHREDGQEQLKNSPNFDLLSKSGLIIEPPNQTSNKM